MVNFWLGLILIAQSDSINALDRTELWSRLNYYFQTAADEFQKPVHEMAIDRRGLNYYGDGKYRLKTFDYLIDQPWQTGPFMQVMAQTLIDYADSLWFLAYYPWARIDAGVRRGLIARPGSAARTARAQVPDDRRQLAERLTSRLAAEKLNFASWPDSLVTGMLLLTAEILNSRQWLEQATANLTKSDLDSVVRVFKNTGEDGFDNRFLERLIAQVDFPSLSAGAVDLGYGLEDALGYFGNLRITSAINFNTSLGRVAVGTVFDDHYDDGPYLLIIDPAGNDDYVGAGVADPDHPIAIIIDLAGDDQYSGPIGPGTGMAGYSLIIDQNGNDSYRSEKFGLATGIFGLGLIQDQRGNDFYYCDRYGEGAGLFGAGTLADLAGDDEYVCFQCSQGFGYVRGCGILLDVQGNDLYSARDDTVLYASAQTAEHNTSLAQGAGFGIRADFTDGHSLAGGCGILVDGQGDDQYDCGVFGQGCGYWFGVGFLVDLGGADQYHGIWYTQGASAHFAFGGLLDQAGNDEYRTEINMGPAAGHDFSLGVLFDISGDDRYSGGGLALGAGNANGMGLLADFSGNDHYCLTADNGLGFASRSGSAGLREYLRGVGLFFDGAGADSYSDAAARDRTRWRKSGPVGIGIDF